MTTRHAAHYNVLDFTKRLFPQTVEAITPEQVAQLSDEIRNLLGIMVDLGRMEITLSQVDSSLVVNLHETRALQADLHFHFLHLMMSKHGLMLYDFNHDGLKVMYRFYKRP